MNVRSSNGDYRWHISVLAQQAFVNLGGAIAALHMVECGHGEGRVIVSGCINWLSLFQGAIFESRIQKR